MLQPVSASQLCWFSCAPLAQLHLSAIAVYQLKCVQPAHQHSVSSGSTMSAQLRCRLSASTATLAINHSLSAMLTPATLPTNCQLNFTISNQAQCVSQCMLSAPLYSVSSSLLAPLQSVCSGAICQLSSFFSFNSIFS